MRPEIRSEWDELKQHDVLFLLTIRPPDSITANYMAQVWQLGGVGVECLQGCHKAASASMVSTSSSPPIHVHQPTGLMMVPSLLTGPAAVATTACFLCSRALLLARMRVWASWSAPACSMCAAARSSRSGTRVGPCCRLLLLLLASGCTLVVQMDCLGRRGRLARSELHTSMACGTAELCAYANTQAHHPPSLLSHLPPQTAS